MRSQVGLCGAEKKILTCCCWLGGQIGVVAWSLHISASVDEKSGRPLATSFHRPFHFSALLRQNLRRVGTAFTPCALREGSNIRHAHNTVDWILFCAALPPPWLACWFHHRRAAVALALFFPLPSVESEFPSPAGDALTERGEREGSHDGAANAARLDPNPACALQAEMREKKMPLARSESERTKAEIRPENQKRRRPSANAVRAKCRRRDCSSPYLPRAPHAKSALRRRARKAHFGVRRRRSYQVLARPVGIVMLAYSSNIIKLRICSFCMTREPWAVTKLS